MDRGPCLVSAASSSVHQRGRGFSIFQRQVGRNSHGSVRKLSVFTVLVHLHTDLRSLGACGGYICRAQRIVTELIIKQ